MSKIYEALKRHGTSTVEAPAQYNGGTAATRGSAVTALEPACELVKRKLAAAGHGLVLHFVAPSIGEGTTTLSSAFARLAAASGELKVLLLDADKERLAAARRAGCAIEQGAYDELAQQNSIESGLVKFDGDGQLKTGALAGTRTPALQRKSLLALYDHCRANYDLTILDCPPAFGGGYFDLLPESADYVLLVVKAEHSRPVIIRRTQARLEETGANVLGAVLNSRRRYIPEFIYRLL